MATSSKARSFHVHSHSVHLRWSNALQPVHTIESGETVTFDLLDGAHNQINPSSTISALHNFDYSLADPAIGPIFINGAQPGDVLKIEILDLQPAAYGWTAILPGFGLLAEDFPDPDLKLWDLSNAMEKGFVEFKKGIHVPIRPFLGVVGVAHAETGEFSTIPPYKTGGNIDCKYVTKGSTLYLPVKVAGALFSCGDGHAAQGDGEICGTAIETPMKASIKLSVMKDMGWIESPQVETAPKELERFGNSRGKGEYMCLGIESDLLEASKSAMRQLIGWLVTTKDLQRNEAYMLCSVAADLRIAEIVDMPNFAVAAVMPLDVFIEA